MDQSLRKCPLFVQHGGGQKEMWKEDKEMRGPRLQPLFGVYSIDTSYVFNDWLLAIATNKVNSLVRESWTREHWLGSHYSYLLRYPYVYRNCQHLVSCQGMNWEIGAKMSPFNWFIQLMWSYLMRITVLLGKITNVVWAYLLRYFRCFCFTYVSFNIKTILNKSTSSQVNSRRLRILRFYIDVLLCMCIRGVIQI